MRIVIDLDGTICELKKANQSYYDVRPKAGAIQTLYKLKEEGHEIIIYTARNMLTCKGNIGKVNANVGKITLDWLASYKIPFDELVFGKPYGDIYIDDLGVKFENWDQVMGTIGNKEV
ncbi:HAD hydrolase family protein [Bacillus sp. 166amftsu]|uniref:HAD hydrolase family protein n=1 Tax=Bacillus sp. 166amftsu TaxID=1761753 RepID=UPI00089B9B6C|nr:HAD hydrolase family protein [Bacillus sp. 166amftsu]SDZ37740.1 capsule biosynthesis phosphatase [Bacillus sp. 166amftsu]